jgi:hypothetical protein
MNDNLDFIHDFVEGAFRDVLDAVDRGRRDIRPGDALLTTRSGAVIVDLEARRRGHDLNK